MKVKTSVSILINCFVLLGCQDNNSTQKGNTSVPEVVSKNQQSKNTVMLGGSKLNSVASNDSGSILGFEDLKIGMGFSPATGQVYRASEPDLTKFIYAPGNSSDPKLAITGCEGMAFKIRASEFAEIKSTSDASIFSSQTGAGVSYGFAKIKASVQADTTHTNEKGDASITKDAGASVACSLYSPVDGPGQDSKTLQENMASAVSNANSSVSYVIQKIRNSKTNSERKKNIAEFYAAFGTHVVSGVRLGEIATSGAVLTQNTSRQTDELKVGISVSTTLPFNLGDAEHSDTIGNASAVDSKAWNASIYNASFPKGTDLEIAVSNILTELNNWKKEGGLIDFTKLKPDPVKIEAFKAPDLSNITIDKETKEAIKLAKTNYKKLSMDLPIFKDQLQVVTKTTPKSTLELYLAKKTTLLDDDAKIEHRYLSSAEQKSYARLEPLLNSIRNVAINISSAAETAKSVDLAFNGSDEKIEKIVINQEEEEREALARQEFKKRYPTLEYYARKIFADGNVGHLEGADYPAWKANMLDHEMRDLWKTKVADPYREQGGGEDIEDIEDEVRRGITDPQLVRMINNGLLKSSLENEEKSNPYKGKLILDFNLVPWDKVYPELSQTTILDDSIDEDINIVQLKVQQYLKIHKYLSEVSRFDDGLTSMLANEDNSSGAFKTISNIMKSINDINSSSITSGNQTIAFKANGINHSFNLGSVNETGDLLSFIDKIEKNSIMYSSGWAKIVERLMDADIIGRYGSLAGLKPANVDGFHFIPGGGTKVSDNPSNLVERILDQVLSTTSFNGEPLSKHGIYTVNMPDAHFKSEFNSLDEFKKTMVSTNKLRNYTTPTSLLFDIPADGKNFDITGIMPLVTAKAKMDGDRIENIAVIDNLGNIWGGNVTQKTGKTVINDKTILYNLDLSKNLTGDDDFPAFTLTPVSVYTYSAIRSGWTMNIRNLLEKDENIYLGVPVTNDLSGIYQKWNNNEFVTKNNLVDLCHSTGDFVFKSYFEIFINQANAFYLSGVSSPKGADKYFCNGTVVASSVNGNRTRYTFNNGGPGPLYFNADLGNAYDIIISPVNLTLIHALANQLEKDPNRRPYLPEYSLFD